MTKCIHLMYSKYYFKQVSTHHEASETSNIGAEEITLSDYDGKSALKCIDSLTFC